MIEKIKLKFDGDLPGFMSKETIDYHYGKHYQNYIDNTNAYIDSENIELLDIINPDIDKTIKLKQNACQVYNHQLFFEALTDKENEPCEELMDWIINQYRTFDIFKKQFEMSANNLFGSGYTTLYLWQSQSGKKIAIGSFSNEQMAILKDEVPLLTLDLWEHSYYIDFKNDRKSYINNFWKYIDWDVVYKRLKKEL